MRMSFSAWQKNHEGQSLPQGAPHKAKNNFDIMLCALEASEKDDGILASTLSNLDWMTPVVQAAYYRNVSFRINEQGESEEYYPDAYDQAFVIKRKPLDLLLESGNQRLIKIGLTEDKIPLKVPLFNQDRMDEHSYQSLTRSNAWAEHLKTAFRIADLSALKKILSWSSPGGDLQYKMQVSSILENPFSALAESSKSMDKETLRACFLWGVEQTAKLWPQWGVIQTHKATSESENHAYIKERMSTQLLVLAAANGHQNLIEVLIQEGAKPSRMALYSLIYSGQHTVFWDQLQVAQSQPNQLKQGDNLTLRLQESDKWQMQLFKNPREKHEIKNSIKDIIVNEFESELKQATRNKTTLQSLKADGLIDFLIELEKKDTHLKGDPKSSEALSYPEDPEDQEDMKMGRPSKASMLKLLRIAYALGQQHKMNAWVDELKPEPSAEELIIYLQAEDFDRLKQRSEPLMTAKRKSLWKKEKQQSWGVEIFKWLQQFRDSQSRHTTVNEWPFYDRGLPKNFEEQLVALYPLIDPLMPHWEQNGVWLKNSPILSRFSAEDTLSVFERIYLKVHVQEQETPLKSTPSLRI